MPLDLARDPDFARTREPVRPELPCRAFSHSDEQSLSETHACAPCAAAAYDTEEDMAWRLRFEDLESKLRNELNSKPYTSKERPD